MKFKNPKKPNPKLVANAVLWLLFRHPEMADFRRIVDFIVRVLWRSSVDEEYFSDWISELEVRARLQGIPLFYYLSFVAVSLLSPPPKSVRPVTRSRKSGGKHGKR